MMSIFDDWRAVDRAIRGVNKAMKPKEKPVETMKDRIERAIAITTLATEKEVYDAYKRLGSWDDVIEAANGTLMGGPMSMHVDYILDTRKQLTDQLVCNKIRVAGINGAKAGRNLRILVHLIDLYAKLAEDADSGASL